MMSFTPIRIAVLKACAIALATDSLCVNRASSTPVFRKNKNRR